MALDPSALVAEVTHHGERLAEEFEARREHRRFALEPALLEHPVSAVLALVAGAQAAVVPLAAAAEAVDFGVLATDLFHGQLPRFPHEVAVTRSRGERLLLVAPAERHAALGELLEGREVASGRDGVEIVSGEIERGYRLPARRGRDLRRDAATAAAGGARRQARQGALRTVPRHTARSQGRRPRRPQRPRHRPVRGVARGRRTFGPGGGGDGGPAALPASLRPFAAPATADNEVMEILYAGGKRLLVPLARLDLIQKYSGIEGMAPRLDQLGGSSWNKTKSKVRSGMRDMAEELLKLYAERQLARAPILAGSTDLERQFAAAFPFEETPDQAEAITIVLDDLGQSKPMDRLLCGDVGFGKTEVAMRAAFRAVDAGYQVAVLAPTTILADQHLEVFTRRFEGFPVTIERLSRLRVGKDLKDLKARIAAGSVDITLGTHRLLSKDVEFERLGLVIVDEEQRFGVAQKERLKQLKKNVHVLAMSATPLPRTLQLSLAGVRDMVVIETPPKDRMAVETAVLPFSEELVREAIEYELERGGQVFYVYNRVESIEQMAGVLRELIPGLRITIGHGQLDERELYRRMHAFTAREFDVLLATTIIENGIDIPTVNTMIVHRADRFGLAQLYQLRGRVGRSRELAYCYLLVPPDAPLTEEARRRLEALREFTELGAGFRIAGRDLEIRGAGNLLGGEQSGHIADLGIETYLKMLEETVRELKGEARRRGAQRGARPAARDDDSAGLHRRRESAHGDLPQARHRRAATPGTARGADGPVRPAAEGGARSARSRRSQTNCRGAAGPGDIGQRGPAGLPPAPGRADRRRSPDSLRFDPRRRRIQSDRCPHSRPAAGSVGGRCRARRAGGACRVKAPLLVAHLGLALVAFSPVGCRRGCAVALPGPGRQGRRQRVADGGVRSLPRAQSRRIGRRSSRAKSCRASLISSCARRCSPCWRASAASSTATVSAADAVEPLLAASAVAEPTDSEIANYFAAHAGELARPERVHLRQILVDDRLAAERARRELVAGLAFDAVLAKVSVPGAAPAGGDQGILARDELPPVFADLIFRLEVGEVSDVVAADYGFHVFEVVERWPAESPVLAEVAPVIRQRLREASADARLQALFVAAQSRYTVAVYDRNLPFNYRGSLPISRPHEER